MNIYKPGCERGQWLHVCDVHWTVGLLNTRTRTTPVQLSLRSRTGGVTVVKIKVDDESWSFFNDYKPLLCLLTKAVRYLF